MFSSSWSSQALACGLCIIAGVQQARAQFSFQLPTTTYGTNFSKPINYTQWGKDCGIAAAAAYYLTWDQSALSTVTYVNATIVPVVSQFRNGSAVTVNETITAASPRPTKNVSTWVTNGFTMTYPTRYISYYGFYSAECRASGGYGTDWLIRLPSTVDASRFWYTANPAWDYDIPESYTVSKPITITSALLEYLHELSQVNSQFPGQDLRTCSFAECAQTAVGKLMLSVSVLMETQEVGAPRTVIVPDPEEPEPTPTSSPDTVPTPPSTIASVTSLPTQTPPPPPPSSQSSDEQPPASSPSPPPPPPPSSTPGAPPGNSPGAPSSSAQQPGENPPNAGSSSSAAPPPPPPPPVPETTIATTFVSSGETVIQTIVTPVNTNPPPPVSSQTIIRTVTSNGQPSIETIVTVVSNRPPSSTTLIRTVTSDGSTFVQTVVTPVVNPTVVIVATSLETIVSNGQTIVETIIQTIDTVVVEDVTSVRTFVTNGATSVETVVSPGTAETTSGYTGPVATGAAVLAHSGVGLVGGVIAVGLAVLGAL